MYGPGEDAEGLILEQAVLGKLLEVRESTMTLHAPTIYMVVHAPIAERASAADTPYRRKSRSDSMAAHVVWYVGHG